mmetsp:Transcript_27600/g.46683  ORF Transcript_27600/g.46683 Transcript_27600/m.46683 type:complete len:339 (+) Transcript_27600:169-1185(+)
MNHSVNLTGGYESFRDTNEKAVRGAANEHPRYSYETNSSSLMAPHDTFPTATNSSLPCTSPHGYIVGEPYDHSFSNINQNFERYGEGNSTVVPSLPAAQQYNIPSFNHHNHQMHGEQPPPPPPPLIPLSMPTSSTSYGCGNLQHKKRSGPWHEEEDQRLSVAVREATSVAGADKKQRVDWSIVSALMGSTRSSKQCYGRYCNSGMDTDASRRVGPWTVEEDSTLLGELQRQRDNREIGSRSRISWSAVSELLGGSRTRKQCMVRYNSVLRFQNSPAKVSGNWGVNEDNKLVEGVRLYRGKGRKGGVAWRQVSEHMGGTRTMKQCKKRWDDAFEHPSSL